MTMKDTPEKKKAGGGEINLLDGKRSLNINIFLKQFRRWAIFAKHLYKRPLPSPLTY